MWKDKLVKAQYEDVWEEEDNGKKSYYIKRQVYPIISPDGKINWFNFLTGGTWMKLFLLIIFLVIVVGLILEYRENVQTCVQIIRLYNEGGVTQNLWP